MRSPYRLDAVLANRRWWWRRRPFPHVTARDVFDAPTYDQIEQAFRDMLKAQASGYLSGHDIHGRTLGPEDSGPLALFASHEWHDMLARLLGVEATGDVNCGLHHHEAGSADGFPHNDLNPGWFADYPTDDGIPAGPARSMQLHNWQASPLRGPTSRNGPRRCRAVLRRQPALEPW